MLKLNDLLTHSGKWAAALLLGSLLSGCGGGGTDNILCGGDPCSSTSSSSTGTTSTTDISNIQDQGTPDSIEFVSADPTQISIKGAGGDETSVVTFLVTDTAGDPIEGVTVNFALDNTVGGISLSNTSDTTNADGQASAIVQSGTAATSFRVEASVASLSSQTASSTIVVSTGIADYDSFTIAVSKVSARAWDYVGDTVTVTARSSDVFNNPVPDGTQVSFYTQGGQIQSSCVMADGGCSVTWTGQNPLAIKGIRPGRSKIMAVVTGAESFVDVNSNGVFDDGDTFDTSSGYATQDDRPEPWLDYNENGIYDSGELFVDFNHNGHWDDANGLYDGPLCEHSTLCSGKKSIAISRTALIVMAGDEPYILTTTLPASINVSGGPQTYSVTIGDINGNSLPSGSKITLKTTNGEITSSTTRDVLSGDSEPATIGITMTTDGTPSNDGQLTISVTTPAATYDFSGIPVQD